MLSSETLDPKVEIMITEHKANQLTLIKQENMQLLYIDKETA